VATGINTRKLYPTSRLVSHVTGIQVQRNKAIVGQNAFAHEAGIHQDGMLKERSTYEIMNPEDVGLSRTELVLGKHSGRHALRQRVLELGYHLDEQQLQKVFEGFKTLADRKKVIYNADIEGAGRVADPQWAGHLGAWKRSAAPPARPPFRRRWSACGTRTAPSSARPAWAMAPSMRCSRPSSASPAIEVLMRDYRLRSVTVGEDAQGEAQIEVEYNGRTLNGRAVSTDIIEASALAFLQVINRIASRKAAQERERILPTQPPPREPVGVS